MPAKAKLTDEQVQTIRRRALAGERVSDLAAEYGVNRKTIRRRLDALARTAAAPALTDVEPALAADEREQGPALTPPSPWPFPVQRGYRGVPLFPETREGQEARLAYYEERRLVDPPSSIWDSNDVRAGRLTPAERRHLRHMRG